MDEQRPTQMTSHVFRMTPTDLEWQPGHTQRAIDDLMAKLHAEDARLRRLLPDPPEGYFWEQSIERNETLSNVDTEFRVAYRLREQY